MEALSVGDYTAEHNGVRDNAVVERKSIDDLWNSYTKNYDRERNKFVRAKADGLKFVLAIEESLFRIREGFEYRKGGEMVPARKDGLSMVRQLMTISRKYDIELWFCNGRKELAFRIYEYFLAKDRINAIKPAQKL